MPKWERIFSISRNNKGSWCPFESIVCQESYCHQCQIYLDWQKLGEMVVICAWCGNVMGTKHGLGKTGISHGICLECQQKYFPKVKVRAGGKGSGRGKSEEAPSKKNGKNRSFHN